MYVLCTQGHISVRARLEALGSALRRWSLSFELRGRAPGFHESASLQRRRGVQGGCARGVRGWAVEGASAEAPRPRKL